MAKALQFVQVMKNKGMHVISRNIKYGPTITFSYTFKWQKPARGIVTGGPPSEYEVFNWAKGNTIIGEMINIIAYKYKPEPIRYTDKHYGDNHL